MEQSFSEQEIRTYYPYRYSYIDKTGRLVIDASKFQRVGGFSEGLAAVWSANEGWGYIDKSGKLVLQPQFSEVLSFSDGLAAVKIGGRWGFVDKSNRIVIEPQYELVNSFSEGIAVVIRAAAKQRSGLPAAGPTVQVESINREVVTLNKNFSEGGVADGVGKGKEVLLIDKMGHVLASQNMDKIQLNVYEGARFSEGLIDAYDCARKKIGFMDKTGKFVVEPQFDQAAPFSEGLARVAIIENGEQKLGFIDHGGHFVINPIFNTDGDFRNSTDFSDGWASLTENLRATVTEEEKSAYIDKNGAIVLFTEFFHAGPFRDGLAVVYDAEGNKWGYINKSGKTVIAPRYDLADHFSDGLAFVAVRD